MSDDAHHVVARLTKSRLEEVRVALGEYRGVPNIDLRTWGLWGDNQSFRPTPKGVTLRIDRLPELIEALEAARDEAERRGLLP